MQRKAEKYQDGIRIQEDLQTAGEYNWKAFHKHKWLKPFAWAYQIGRYARKGLQAKRSGTQLREDIIRGRRRKELLQKLNIKQPE